MGTWGSGPLENETAEDVLDSLVEMSPEERLATIGGFFGDAIGGAEAGRLLVLPEEVIAGACVVAAGLPAASSMPWLAERPEIQGWLPDVPPETVREAHRALAVVALDNEQYWAAWVDESDKAEARDALDELAGALA